MYYYECTECGTRYLSTTAQGFCSKCEGVVTNVVARRA